MTIQEALQLIAQEREEQIVKHEKTELYDTTKNKSWELKEAACALLLPGKKFPEHWDKKVCEHMNKKSYRDRLVIAAALLVAELQRIDNVAQATKNRTEGGSH